MNLTFPIVSGALRRSRLAVSLLCALFPALLCAQVNHRPTIGYVPDQRITSGNFAGQTVTVGDDITAVNLLGVSVSSSNFGWYAASNVVVSTTGASRTITFNNTPSTNGATTITLTVMDDGSPAKSSATAFTLQRASSASGTVLQRIPNWTMPVNTGAPTTAYGPVTFVVKDDGLESGITLAGASTGSFAPTYSFGGQNYGRTVTVTPPANQSGRATVTITATDASSNTTSTAFVLDVVSGNTAPPVITSLASFHRQTLPDTAETVAFTVGDGDGQTAAADMRVTAVSSNTSLVPLTGLSVGGGGSSRNITVTPTGSTAGTATITLTISDGDISRQVPFLYVVHDPADAVNDFPRSAGLFILDSAGGTDYDTSFGKAIQLRDDGISSDPHVTGYTLRVFWKNVESPNTPGNYDFFIIENALNQLPAGQVLSIIVADGEPDDPGEPDYIATGASLTWTHNNLTRAVPWDAYLLERREALWAAMSAYEVDGIPLAVHPRIAVINPYLPGGHSGIRDPDPQNGVTLSSLAGYSRSNLLAVVQEDLRNAQDFFPGKVVQIGFWKVLDSEDASYGGTPAWDWLRQQLLAEFSDSDRPRVGFFMENLAATKPLPDAAYTATPTTTFGQALYASRADTWGGLQMLGSWTKPFNDGHVTNTLNGAPHDSMEYANKNFNARYFEVYNGDMASTGFLPALQGWHDYLASVAAPAGLMALSVSSSAVDVVWSTVTGATSYTLQRRTVGGTFGTIYTGSTASYDDTGLSAGTEYHYRVRATTADGDTAYAASFPAITSTPVTLLSDGFESNFNLWTDGGATNWDRTGTQLHSGSFSAHAGATDDDLISDNLDTSGYSSITIDFWYRDDDIDDDDNVYLQLFDGTAYDNNLELGLGTEDTWQHATITLNNSGGDAQYFHANFRLKFEGTSIDSGENLWIDDVTVTVE